jgi:hypothetical protein
MPTSYMKLPHEVKVLKPDALRLLELEQGPVGFTLDVGLNYYRGLPLSTIEELALVVDGEAIPDNLLLFEYNDKLFPPSQIGLAFTEFWSVKKDLRIRAYQGGLAAGSHTIELTLHMRCPYMQFAPGVWGAIDSSATRELVLQESK